ncbi:hypothetical protein L4C35_15770 [Photobacterium kagoshimensis]
MSHIRRSPTVTPVFFSVGVISHMAVVTNPINYQIIFTELINGIGMVGGTPSPLLNMLLLNSVALQSTF